jgi:hypothetical protein
MATFCVRVAVQFILFVRPRLFLFISGVMIFHLW